MKHEATLREIFFTFLRLGLTSFGGPIAHIAFFREEFVSRKKYLSEKEFANLLALCHILPGPASSQLGISIGYLQKSYAGGFLAWLGFTLPSALIMILLAAGLINYHDQIPQGLLSGLKIAAAAVVAQAVWNMGKQFCKNIQQFSTALASCLLVLLFPSIWMPFLIISIFACIGFVRNHNTVFSGLSGSRKSFRILFLWTFIFLLFLLGLPLAASLWDKQFIQLFDSFFRVGAMVFGGGHVVLPLLQAEFVDAGFIDKDFFVAGYGAAQAIPGPLFTFSAFLGTGIGAGMGTGMESQHPFMMGLLCLIAVFLPSFILIFALLPIWNSLQYSQALQASLIFVNAAVVGLLLAAFYNPVLLSSIHNGIDFIVLIISFLFIEKFKMPSWLVVLLNGMLGSVLFLLLG